MGPSEVWYESEGAFQFGMDRQERMKKKNKSLGTERFVNIVTLCI